MGCDLELGFPAAPALRPPSLCHSLTFDPQELRPQSAEEAVPGVEPERLLRGGARGHRRQRTYVRPPGRCRGGGEAKSPAQASTETRGKDLQLALGRVSRPADDPGVHRLCSVSGGSGRQRSVIVLQQLEQEEEPRLIHAGLQRSSVLRADESPPAGQPDAEPGGQRSEGGRGSP